MDYGNLLGESFNYAKEGVVDKGKRWVLLIIAFLILFIPLMGYLSRIFRGIIPAPEVDNWGKLFIDGIMLIIVSIIYSIPLFIIYLLYFVTLVATIFSGNPTAMITGMAGAGILFLVCIIVAIIIGLIVPFAMIRLARTGNFGEAFNFNAILAHIGKIGWFSYILALILGVIVMIIPLIILTIIAFILSSLVAGFGFRVDVNWIFIVLLVPSIAVFYARYITQIYDTVAP